jgi:hypothetical protein
VTISPSARPNLTASVDYLPHRDLETARSDDAGGAFLLPARAWRLGDPQFAPDHGSTSLERSTGELEA